jgi:5-formyltetrahydrofolate cyclo-ligase
VVPHPHQAKFDFAGMQRQGVAHGVKISGMSQADASNAKKLLRARLSAARQDLVKHADVASGLERQLLNLVHHLGAKLVAAYLPFGTEPNTYRFVTGAAGHGVRLIMPVSHHDGSMRWVHYTGESAPGIFGFEEPVGPPANLTDAQLILIPASAVDQRGNRLGKGKGFYDVALADASVTAPVAAVVYDSEVLAEIPVEDHDQPVGFIVTPSRLIEIG